MKKALNQMTVPHLGFEAFLELAGDLGCVGIEARNDLEALGRPLFDGMAAAVASDMIRARGLRLLGLSQVYPFNSWDEARAKEVAALIATAQAAGAETISLIPRNDGTGGANGERQANLRIALKEIHPMLREAGLVALVEPLGFTRSSLRFKSELVKTIEALDAWDSFALVHDTFHHTIAGGGDLYPDRTGIVHISGLVDPTVPVDQMDDAHRVLVDEHDRLGNIEQIAALLAAGYDGAISFESFAPETQNLADPLTEIGRSFDFIESRVSAPVA